MFSMFCTMDMNTFCSCAHVVGEWSDVEQKQLHSAERPIGHSSDVAAVLLWYIPQPNKKLNGSALIHSPTKQKMEQLHPAYQT
jgi:predicted alpha/beta hydrolase family esterase